MKYISFFLKTFHHYLNLIIARLIVIIMRVFYKKKDIWIIGGNGGKFYSDNSAELHQYILSKHPNINLFWIIEKYSPDIKTVKEFGPILYKHSLKANIYVLLAEVLICNHSIRGDIMRAKQKTFSNAITVDLFHGITAFKSKSNYPKNDIVIATSDFEKEIKLDWPNTSEENIVVTGFPRFDTLYKYKGEYKKPKSVFYMPTWRPWLMKKWVNPSENDIKKFKNSIFYNEINNFLTDVELNEYLTENDYTLNLFIHVNLHKFIKTFLNDNELKNINILPANTNVQQELINSSLLITDYSSVAWDFLFIDKPTIFYQFDLDVYQENNESYIDMSEELFGPVTKNYKDTIHILKDLMNEKNKLKQDNVRIMRDKLIKYDDNKNCERVVQAIKERL